MKNYEMMYVVDPATEEGHDAVKQKIEGIITGREGTISLFEKLGKKRLAYPIKKRQYGVYYLVNLSGDNRIVQALESFLLLNPVVLRHIVLAFTDKELSLRTETDRIQLEEAERMRLGGRPLGATGDEEVVEFLDKDNLDADLTAADKSSKAKGIESAKTIDEKLIEINDEFEADTSEVAPINEETQVPVEEVVLEAEEFAREDNSDIEAENASSEVDDNESKDKTMERNNG